MARVLVFKYRAKTSEWVSTTGKRFIGVLVVIRIKSRLLRSLSYFARC